MADPTIMSTVAGLSSLNSLIQYNQGYGKATTASSTTPIPPTTDAQTSAAAGLQVQQQSVASILGAVTPAGATLDGASTIPSSLYENISTYATLNAVQEANGFAASQNKAPFLPLGTAAEAAATGQAAQQANELALVNTLNTSGDSLPSSTPYSFPSAYLSAAYSV